MTTLHLIANTDNPQIDVVFMHGLDGDAYTTWGLDQPVSWHTWLSADRPDWDIWSLDYDVPSSAWKEGTALPLVERAISALAEFDSRGLGRRPLFLVCHSMGGLLAKQMLREATENPSEYGHVGQSTRGLVFLSTPHHGSEVADLVVRYLGFFYRKTVAMSELRYHSTGLEDLARWYLNHVDRTRIGNLVFYETVKTGRLCLKRHVVDRHSANPGIPQITPIPIDANHYEICVPESHDDKRYAKTLMFIEDCLSPREAGSPESLPALQVGDRRVLVRIDTARSGIAMLRPSANQEDEYVGIPIEPGDHVKIELCVLGPDGRVHRAHVTERIPTGGILLPGKIDRITGSSDRDVREGSPILVHRDLSKGLTLMAGPVVDRPGFVRFSARLDRDAVSRFLEEELPPN